MVTGANNRKHHARRRVQDIWCISYTGAPYSANAGVTGGITACHGVMRPSGGCQGVLGVVFGVSWVASSSAGVPQDYAAGGDKDAP